MQAEIDVAVVGGGVAGLTAGMYAARNGMRTVLFEAMMPGGQTATILRLENYPGFPDGVDGAALAADILRQAEAAGCELRYEAVQEIIPAEAVAAPHTIVTAAGRYAAKTVILAGGAAPRRLGLPREEELTGHGVSYCATCDGALFRGKRVAVVGGGNTALTDALVLSRYAERVFLIHRREAFRGSRVLEDRVRATAQIELLLSRTVSGLLGTDKLSGLQLAGPDGADAGELAVDGLFVAVGVSPVSEFVADCLQRSSNGGIVTDARMQTSLPGVYAAGDCRDTALRQVVTAAADGAVAAASASEYVMSLG